MMVFKIGVWMNLFDNLALECMDNLTSFWFLIQSKFQTGTKQKFNNYIIQVYFIIFSVFWLGKLSCGLQVISSKV